MQDRNPHPSGKPSQVGGDVACPASPRVCQYGEALTLILCPQRTHSYLSAVEQKRSRLDTGTRNTLIYGSTFKVSELWNAGRRPFFLCGEKHGPCSLFIRLVDPSELLECLALCSFWREGLRRESLPRSGSFRSVHRRRWGGAVQEGSDVTRRGVESACPGTFHAPRA